MKRFFVRNRGIVIYGVILLFLCGGLFFKNWKEAGFFSAKLTDIITIIVGSVIAVFITEKLTDKRRRNDCIEHIVVEIENFITNDNNFIVDKSTLIKQGSCANRIKYLKDAGFTDIEGDIEFIETNFENIRDLYSNHNQSEEALQRVKVDIDKHRMNIVDKCSKIRVGLYSGI